MLQKAQEQSKLKGYERSLQKVTAPKITRQEYWAQQSSTTPKARYVSKYEGQYKVGQAVKAFWKQNRRHSQWTGWWDAKITAIQGNRISVLYFDNFRATYGPECIAPRDTKRLAPPPPSHGSYQ